MARSGGPQTHPTGAAAGTVGAVLMGIAAAIHYLQNNPHGPVLSLVIVATILFVVCLFLSKPKIPAPAVSAGTPAEKLKDLLARREAINAEIAELETAVKASIDQMTGLLGKIHSS